MATNRTSGDIDRAASEWTARLDNVRALEGTEEQAFRDWLDSDPRCRGALLRAQAVFLRSEAAGALGTAFNPADFADSDVSNAPPDPGSSAPRRSFISRREALKWTRGAAIAAVAASAISFSLPASGAVIRTAKGEMRRVPLEDGSSVLLNTDSAIRINYNSATRLVALLEGEAFFSVAANEQRPFVVQVDEQRLRTDNARFSLRKLDAEPVFLLVQQGEVRLPQALGAGAALAVGSNMRLTLPRSAPPHRPVEVRPQVLQRELAWRTGKLAFEGETLEQAANAFARYSDHRIVVRDQALAHETVTGLFAANDPVGFSRAVATSFGASVTTTPGGVVLTRGSPPR